MKTKIDRRDFLGVIGSAAASLYLAGSGCTHDTLPDRPNIVIIFCDDMGYGDIGPFGHPTIRTPYLDNMAQEGQKWTNFYVGASVCTPSRAALLTGRLPIRSGMCSDKRRVLFPDSAGGLPENEITLARALKQVGYNTACIGKWHLGHLPQYLPTSHGFDSYFGIPYSNDMDRIEGVEHFQSCVNPIISNFQVPLMRDEQVVERPANQTTITRRYTEDAVKFIKSNKRNPFFLYLAHTMPHVPLFTSQKFQNKSLRGVYGDVIEELDWSVGQILDTLRDENLDKDTLVVFTSDNGPWLLFNELGGSAGLLREGKGTTWEGGMREPTIFWWPGQIRNGVEAGLGTTMDLFATAITLAGAKLPDDRVIDGLDLSPALFNKGSSPRNLVFFYRGTSIYAVRKGMYKAHFITKSAYGEKKEQHHDPPLLYHLGHDPSEIYNLADKHPEVIAEIRTEIKKHQNNLKPGEDQLVRVIQDDGDLNYKDSIK